VFAARLARTLPVVLAVAVAPPGGAAAAPPAPDAMVLIREAATLTITSGTGRDPVGLTLVCEAHSPLIARCRGAWRDRRYSYDGHFIAVDETDAVTALFAGTRTDRACAKHRTGAARRVCRDGVSF